MWLVTIPWSAEREREVGSRGWINTCTGRDEKRELTHTRTSWFSGTDLFVTSPCSLTQRAWCKTQGNPKPSSTGPVHHPAVCLRSFKPLSQLCLRARRCPLQLRDTGPSEKPPEGREAHANDGKPKERGPHWGWTSDEAARQINEPIKDPFLP